MLYCIFPIIRLRLIIFLKSLSNSVNHLMKKSYSVLVFISSRISIRKFMIFKISEVDISFISLLNSCPWHGYFSVSRQRTSNLAWEIDLPSNKLLDLDIEPRNLSARLGLSMYSQSSRLNIKWSLRNSDDWNIEANYWLINSQSSKHSFSFLRIGRSQFGREVLGMCSVRGKRGSLSWCSKETCM